MWAVSDVDVGVGTCGERDLHGPLSVPQNLKLRQRDLVGDSHRVGPLVPLIPDISHRVTDCNHKPVPAAAHLPKHFAAAIRHTHINTN